MEREACIACAQFLNVTLTRKSVPACGGTAFTQVTGYVVPTFCTYNQTIFNMCIKAFVILFSYINFLPIPWRLAIFHHAWCSSRIQMPKVCALPPPSPPLHTLDVASRRSY